ncbi:MAG: hypothetical protein ACD_31C00002G0028 [uncultured bacterium]|uniref:Penicillin-binding protein transpeptidase domain-containing protein n=3 Tax=Candidatus Daviesiibacteriota TaxID=1752718 RepID=A0A1F5K6I5_9BACT|nr:MAG: hypothetical protein ACD_31C00002G0028 [uncultured bacterium]KKQ15655.1 MAG: Peptidoglycan glycosyltransferase [Candidatus Daviesbacteria bacterium GW2011_GWA1_36_8]OGE17488.1 MAG: hypothetical protein A2858_01100 [Candidatus Daviesbacteria bacterium RIFCSPHIGHO2_01_FULL_36_37]OGE36583.1 MAG: hypothetical protein A3E66_02945 [Candidatus Daviesbacteria bacterium RIFCSPHIGHO2_12_FULL_37_16]
MRIRFLKISFFVIIFSIILRLGYWQILKSDELTARAEGQRTSIKNVIAPRGTIFYQDGSTLATSQPAYLVYVQPKSIVIPKSFNITEFRRFYAQKLAEVFWEEDQKLKLKFKEDKVGTDSAKLEAIPPVETAVKTDEEIKKDEKKQIEDFIIDRLSQDLYWVSLARKVDLETKKRLEKLNLEGLGFEPTSQRFYPEGSSSAHLLGFIGSDIYGAETGYFGIEGFYNGELKGTPGLLKLEKDALGLPILIGQFINKIAKPGKNLTLTVDRTVQYIVERNLRAGVEKYKAKGGSVVVLEPSSGNILAMASIPGYDPIISYLYPGENFRNPITAESYEPGSTFKVLVMAAGINEGVVQPDTRCDSCSGPVNLAGYTIKTWNNKYLENQTMAETIIHSDNTGMVFVGKKLGIDKMYEYIRNFGFGDVTNVDLQDEQSPPLREKKDWKEIDLATASFGQGISVTPMQLIRGVAAIANGGKLVEPKVVKEISDGKGVTKIRDRILGNPISEETSKTITKMMIQAVDKGEAQFYKKKIGLQNYKIAGKTGTAQIAVAGHYDPTKTIASFIGFAPAENPKFVMLVRFNEPSSSIFGADTAAPTFFEIAKELFLYYGIAPSVQ